VGEDTGLGVQAQVEAADGDGDGVGGHALTIRTSVLAKRA
jgi:hypothetical protein